ncbi:MAG TPA: Clp protease N-terminal domain-containing protein, partial [Chroococcales cyanobacterium]
MNLERFTHKAQEAITNCRALLTKFGHSQVSPEHVLLSIMEQQDGIAVKVAERLKAKPETIVKETEDYLHKQPKGSAVTTNK